MAQHSGLDTDIRHGLGHCRTILEVAVKLLNQGLSKGIIVGHIVRNILGNLFLQYCDCERSCVQYYRWLIFRVILSVMVYITIREKVLNFHCP